MSCLTMWTVVLAMLTLVSAGEICFQNNQPTMEELLLQLQRLDTKLAIQESKNAALEAKLSTLSCTMESKIETVNNSMKAEMSTLSDAIETKIDRMNNSIEAEKSEVKESLSTVSSLETKMSSLEVSIMNKTMSQSSDSRRAASFMAINTNNQYISGSAVVVFNLVHHNTAPPGYGYNNADGRFRCPYDGTYVFYVTVVAYHDAGVQSYAIMRGGTSLAAALESITRNGDPWYQSMSAMAVTPCTKGEHVFVKNEQSTRNRVVVLGGIGYTHFAGFRIY